METSSDRKEFHASDAKGDEYNAQDSSLREFGLRINNSSLTRDVTNLGTCIDYLVRCRPLGLCH